MGVELFASKVLNFKCQGYAEAQLEMMNEYELLLLKFGDKNYSSAGEGWPVEIQIAWMALLNAVIFVAFRTFASWIPSDAVGKIARQINLEINSSGPDIDPETGEILEDKPKNSVLENILTTFTSFVNPPQHTTVPGPNPKTGSNSTQRNKHKPVFAS
jgi:hypothetical protein